MIAKKSRNDCYRTQKSYPFHLGKRERYLDSIAVVDESYICYKQDDYYVTKRVDTTQEKTKTQYIHWHQNNCFFDGCYKTTLIFNDDTETLLINKDKVNSFAGPKCLRCGANREYPLNIKDCCGYIHCSKCDDLYICRKCDYCEETDFICVCGIRSRDYDDEATETESGMPSFCALCNRLSCGNRMHNSHMPRRIQMRSVGVDEKKASELNAYEMQNTSAHCSKCKRHFCSLCNPLIKEEKVAYALTQDENQPCLCNKKTNPKHKDCHCPLHPLLCSDCVASSCTKCSLCGKNILGEFILCPFCES